MGTFSSVAAAVTPKGNGGSQLEYFVHSRSSGFETSNRASPEEAFSASLYQMELDRLRYSLSKYLRTRLRKVERDALHVLATADGEMQGRLSDR